MKHGPVISPTCATQNPHSLPSPTHSHTHTRPLTSTVSCCSISVVSHCREDHKLHGRKTSVITLLGRLITHPAFPSWLRVLASTRPDKDVLQQLKGNLDASNDTRRYYFERVLCREDHNVDVENLVKVRLNHLNTKHPTSSAMSKAMLSRCKEALLRKANAYGNFLYADSVLDAIHRKDFPCKMSMTPICPRTL